MSDYSLARCLLQGKILVSVSNIVNEPLRTGIQRVLYEFCKRWPLTRDTVPFVALGADRIALLGPEFYDGVRNYFEVKDDLVGDIYTALHDDRWGINLGYFSILNARFNTVAEVSVSGAVEHCRAVISLEESMSSDFYSAAAKQRPDKIFNLCHDFLVWTRPEYFPMDWSGLHQMRALANRRLYHHNFFTSTAVRDEFVHRIDRGHRKQHAVIPIGAEGLGSASRSGVPASQEFVVIGTLEPRKQPLHILQSVKRVRSEGYDARLCFAGRMGWLDDDDRESLLEAFKSFEWVRWIDSPNDAELRDLLANARASVYMSLAEGFGLPPMESLALGVPCIVSSDIPSIRDLANNGQIRVKPTDSEELNSAIKMLLRDDVVIAKQIEIASLALPTWQGFVDGIEALITLKVPSKADSAQRMSSFVDRVATARLLSQIGALPRTRLITEFLQVLLGSDAANEVREMWIEKADAMFWSKEEALLAIMTQTSSGKCDQSIFAEALAGRLRSEALFQRAPGKLQSGLRTSLENVMLTESNAEFLWACYEHIFQRTPSSEELSRLLPIEAGGSSRAEIVLEFLSSGEFEQVVTDTEQRLSALNFVAELATAATVQTCLDVASNKGFIACAYRGLFGREPDRNGVTTYTNRLEAGWSRPLCLAFMMTSPEYDRKITDIGSHQKILMQLVEKMSPDERRRTKLDMMRAPDLGGASLGLKLVAALELEIGAFVQRVFQALFGKQPSEADCGIAVSRLDRGANRTLLTQSWTLKAALEGNLAIAERRLVEWAAKGLRDAFAKLDSKALVIELGYEVFLGRMPDDFGRSLYLERFNNGLLAHEFIEFLRGSDEYGLRALNQAFNVIIRDAIFVSSAAT